MNKLNFVLLCFLIACTFVQSNKNLKKKSMKSKASMAEVIAGMIRSRLNHPRLDSLLEGQYDKMYHGETDEKKLDMFTTEILEICSALDIAEADCNGIIAQTLINNTDGSGLERHEYVSSIREALTILSDRVLN